MASAQVFARPSTMGSPRPTRPASVCIFRNSQRGLTKNVSSLVILSPSENGTGAADPDCANAAPAAIPAAAPCNTERRWMWSAIGSYSSRFDSTFPSTQACRQVRSASPREILFHPRGELRERGYNTFFCDALPLSAIRARLPSYFSLTGRRSAAALRGWQNPRTQAHATSHHHRTPRCQGTHGKHRAELRARALSGC